MRAILRFANPFLCRNLHTDLVQSRTTPGPLGPEFGSSLTKEEQRVPTRTGKRCGCRAKDLSRFSLTHTPNFFRILRTSVGTNGSAATLARKASTAAGRRVDKP